MTKEVMVSIKGLQFDQSADNEEIETIQWGQYYKKNGTHYVIYDELMEGCEEPTKNIIKFRERELNLTKRGLVNVYMVFEEKEIRVNVDYALEVNYEYLADCKIEMYIRPKDNGGIDLLS